MTPTVLGGDSCRSVACDRTAPTAVLKSRSARPDLQEQINSVRKRNELIKASASETVRSSQHGPKEMVSPCLVHLHLISLVAQSNDAVAKVQAQGRVFQKSASNPAAAPPRPHRAGMFRSLPSLRPSVDCVPRPRLARMQRPFVAGSSTKEMTCS